jgi:large subunit ribosomal protein L32e
MVFLLLKNRELYIRKMAIKRKKTKFLRIGYTQYSKLGLRRKNKQKYRKGKGGENKMRLKMKGHLRNVSIGFRNEKRTRGLVKGLTTVMVYNIGDLKNLKKDEIGLVAKVGAKRKIEIANYAITNNIRLANLNSKKFITKIEEGRKKLKEEKEKREEKKKVRDKKAKEAEKKKEEEEKKSKEDKKAKNEKETELEKAVKNTESDVKTNVEEIKK